MMARDVPTSCWFADPDGRVWEVACDPDGTLAANASVGLGERTGH